MLAGMDWQEREAARAGLFPPHAFDLLALQRGDQIATPSALWRSSICRGGW
jgi:hypothetical protein